MRKEGEGLGEINNKGQVQEWREGEIEWEAWIKSFQYTLCNSNYFQCATVEANKTHEICNINRQNERVYGGGMGIEWERV